MAKKTFATSAVKSQLIQEIADLTQKVRNDIKNIIMYEPEILRICTKLTLSVYSKKQSEFDSLNDLRIHLFPRKKNLNSLPPTDGSFVYHVKRAILQWSIILQAVIPKPCVLNPLEFGWTHHDILGVSPVTSALTPLASIC